MDRITRGIFRSWNWPKADSATFAQRPTPYRISKNYSMNPSSVYRRWRQLFDEGHVRKVIFLPSDDLVQRRAVIVTGVNRSDFEAMVSSAGDAYFLELMHFGHAYHASGEMATLRQNGDVFLLEFTTSSEDLVMKQAKLLLRSVNKDARPLMIPKGNPVEVGLSENVRALARRLFYQDIYAVRLGEIAAAAGVSERTAGRWFNKILEAKALTAYPMLDQSKVEDYRLCIAGIQYDKGMSASVALNRAVSLGLVSDRYLLYRVINGSLSLLMYYNSLGELDRLVDELGSAFSHFEVITRFESRLNEQLVK